MLYATSWHIYPEYKQKNWVVVVVAYFTKIDCSTQSCMENLLALSAFVVNMKLSQPTFNPNN